MEQFFGFMFLASFPLAFCFAAMSAMMSRIRPDRPNFVYFDEAAEVLAQAFEAPHRVPPSLIDQMTCQLRDAINANFTAQHNSMQEVHDRSIALLKEWLTPAQLKQFEQYNYFDVTGNHTKTRYRIRGGNGPYNVAELRKGEPVMCLCFVPTFGFGGSAALGDTLLAQKIMLENDELEAMQIANRTTSHPYLAQFDTMAAASLTPS
jgi:hypothetical protein